MDMDEKVSFSKRLNQLLDEIGVSPKGRGRQIAVGKMFGKNQKSARRWLEGEGFPELALAIRMATLFNVSLEWLLTGRGEKRLMEPTSALLAELLDCWYRLPETAQSEIVTFARYVAEKTSIKTRPPEIGKTLKPH